MIQRRIALRSLRHLCTFIGAIALFSYFVNLAVDLRHWFMTLASALVCAILWVIFCMLEVHKEKLVRVLLPLMQASLERLSHLRSKPEESSSPANPEEKPIT